MVVDGGGGGGGDDGGGGGGGCGGDDGAGGSIGGFGDSGGVAMVVLAAVVVEVAMGEHLHRRAMSVPARMLYSEGSWPGFTATP